MGCPDIPTWYLQKRIPVIDLRSPTWHRARDELLGAKYEAATCLMRLAESGKVRQLGKGRWQVVDPSREPPVIAVADALFRDVPHYLTTDAALAAQGLIEQPLPIITVVVQQRVRPLHIGSTTVRGVTVTESRFLGADVFDTSRDGFRVRLATPAQAVVDAVVEPTWMVHSTLLPEVLAQLDEGDIVVAAQRTLERSKAAAARLGYLLEDAARQLPPVLVAFRPVATTELRPGRRGPYSTRWRVYG
jgi:predicted transcriptional regulator of viral defense system